MKNQSRKLKNKFKKIKSHKDNMSYLSKQVKKSQRNKSKE